MKFLVLLAALAGCGKSASHPDAGGLPVCVFLLPDPSPAPGCSMGDRCDDGNSPAREVCECVSPENRWACRVTGSPDCALVDGDVCFGEPTYQCPGGCGCGADDHFHCRD